MPVYKAPLRDMRFCLYELMNGDDLTSLPGYEDFGRDLVDPVLEEAAKRAGFVFSELLKPEWLNKVFKKFTLNSVEDMYAAVGYGGISTGQILQRLAAEYRREQKALRAETAPPASESHAKKKDADSRGIIVKGHKGMLVRFAQCCNPVPHDDIVGFITRGRGVSVHRKNCTNILDISSDPSRFIEVAWEDDADSDYRARLTLQAYDRTGLVVDIYKIIDANEASLQELNAKVSAKGVVSINMLVQIKDKQQLEALAKSFRKMPEMIDVYRGS